MFLYPYCFVGIFRNFSHDTKRNIRMQVEVVKQRCLCNLIQLHKVLSSKYKKIKENVPCVSNNVKNIIFHALSWKVKKKHGQLCTTKKFLKLNQGLLHEFFFKSYYLILLFRKIAWTCCGGYEWMRKTWSTHKVFRIYLDLKILKNSSSTTLNV